MDTAVARNLAGAATACMNEIRLLQDRHRVRGLRHTQTRKHTRARARTFALILFYTIIIIIYNISHKEVHIFILIILRVLDHYKFKL